VQRFAISAGRAKKLRVSATRIGVKNHGLKTCFTVGDEILIQSEGKRFKQTLYRYGVNAAPTPGAFKFPEPDASAPEEGCRIEVP
jgi:hypothetical protein